MKDYSNQQIDFMPMDSWRVMRIMSEFVESFETMRNKPKMLVSVFGSARTAPDDPVYTSARELGNRLAEATVHKDTLTLLITESGELMACTPAFAHRIDPADFTPVS